MKPSRRISVALALSLAAHVSFLAFAPRMKSGDAQLATASQPFTVQITEAPAPVRQLLALVAAQFLGTHHRDEIARHGQGCRPGLADAAATASSARWKGASSRCPFP